LEWLGGRCSLFKYIIIYLPLPQQNSTFTRKEHPSRFTPYAVESTESASQAIPAELRKESVRRVSQIYTKKVENLVLCSVCPGEVAVLQSILKHGES
jgi:hypothetical protein